MGKSELPVSAIFGTRALTFLWCHRTALKSSDSSKANWCFLPTTVYQKEPEEGKNLKKTFGFFFYYEHITGNYWDLKKLGKSGPLQYFQFQKMWYSRNRGFVLQAFTLRTNRVLQVKAVFSFVLVISQAMVAGLFSSLPVPISLSVRALQLQSKDCSELDTFQSLDWIKIISVYC